MTETTGSGGHQCPQCGTPKGPDGSPSCDCNQRASDALRDARTAEQAAAEDFDPLRIRPYVAIERDADGYADGGETEVLPVTAVPVVAEATVPLRAVPADVPGPAPEALEAPDAAEAPRRGPRWALLLSIAGAVIGILAVAGFASGLFAHATPTRDEAAPKDVRESVPDVTPSTASPSAAAPVTSPGSSAPAAPSGSASPSVSHSASPAPSSASPSPSPSRSPSPAVSAST
ncbi:peptidoglycan-binding protein, partial [Streptomyces sp. NPDC059627]